MIVFQLPKVDGIQHSQVVVYQANTSSEFASHDTRQGEWVHVSYKKGAEWGHRDFAHQGERNGSQ
jgi:hypothetical protein